MSPNQNNKTSFESAKILSLIFLAVISLFTSSCSQDNPASIKQINTEKKRFGLDLKKDAYRKPFEIIKFMDIQQGSTIIDMFGGGGYYTEWFSQSVGSNGKVYLQNTSTMLNYAEKEIQNRLNENRLTNVVRIDSEYSDLNLPHNVDTVFIGLGFHDIYVKRKTSAKTANREEFYTQLRNSLKKDGILIVIDHASAPGTGTSKTNSLHRIDEEWTKEDITSEGFEYIDSLGVLRNPQDNYNLDVWNESVIHKTDRFIHRYRKK